MKTYLIYLVTNKINGMCYVGRTSSTLVRRKSWHYSNAKRKTNGKYANNTKFSKALREYPKDTFKWEVLEEGLTKERGYTREAYYINELKALTNGYNEKTGDLTPWNKGKKMSQAYCDNLKGENNGMYGKHHSDEYKKWRSEYMSKNQFGSDNAVARKVRCIDTGQIWGSVVECANDTGINSDNISSCCNPKRRNKTAGGFRFEYIGGVSITHADGKLKGENNPKAKAVICVETSRSWNTIRECAKDIGVSESAIGRACRNNSASKGFHFKYV